MVKKMLGFIAVGLVIVLVLVTAAYRRDMQREYERVQGKSTVYSSPYGDIEYTRSGQGVPVLVIHGSGGGYDQGELIAEGLLDAGFDVIAPSRFGYLRSTYKPGATFDDQAHAYAALLDHLGIEKAAVVTLSHGGPSALLFAVLHPERVTSLTLVSAGVVTVATENQGEADRMGKMLTAIFERDWLYWGITKLFKPQFMELMGANKEVIAQLTPAQQQIVDRVINEMNPVSLRSAGAAFDNQTALPGERIAAIQAPTLIVHATDDTLQLFHNAQFAADTIPGAQLARYESGGHLLFAVEQAEVSSRVQEHIRNNAGATLTQSR